MASNIPLWVYRTAALVIDGWAHSASARNSFLAQLHSAAPAPLAVALTRILQPRRNDLESGVVECARYRGELGDHVPASAPNDQ